MKAEKKWPEVWPGYETVGKLGRGGYGTVWKVRKVDLSGEYYSAVKKISIPSGEEEYASLSESGYGEEEITTIFKSRLDKIEAEFKLMEEFQGHSNIVSYQEHMEIEHEDGVGWDILIRMELLEPLGKCYDRFSEKEVIKLGIHMCTALETIQRQHIIHRDIKPSNILYNEKLGYYKLADFGIAKTMDHVTKGTMIGTADYIAPEVFNKEAYGFQADQYSLGLVLYWMLNKRRLPFIPLDHVPTDDEMQTAKQKRVNGAEIPAPYHGGDELKAVVLKACAYDPADRYPDISAMKRALYACSGQADGMLFHDLNSASAAETTQKDVKPVTFPPSQSEEEADETIGSAFPGKNHNPINENQDSSVNSPFHEEQKGPVADDAFDHYDENDDETMGTMGHFGKKKSAPPKETKARTPIVKESKPEHDLPNVGSSSHGVSEEKVSNPSEVYEQVHQDHDYRAESIKGSTEADASKEKIKILICIIFIALIVMLAIFGDFIAPYDYYSANYNHNRPNSYFGDTFIGIDLFSIIMHATRMHIYYALALSLTGLVLGLLPGVLAGKTSGNTARVIDKCLTILCGIPGIVICFILTKLLYQRNTDTNLVFAFGFYGGLFIARALSRIMHDPVMPINQSLSVRVKHIAKRLSGHFVELIGLAVAYISIAGFIGLIPSIMVNWGGVMSGYSMKGFSIDNFMREFTYNPRTFIIPFMMTVLTIFSFSYIGRYIRSYLNTKQS